MAAYLLLIAAAVRGDQPRSSTCSTSSSIRACAARAAARAWQGTEMATRSAVAGWLHRVSDSDVWWSFKSLADDGGRGGRHAASSSPRRSSRPCWRRTRRSIRPRSASSDGLKPPVLVSADGDWTFPLGTDDQGRDMLSSIMYGTRLSLIVGFASVIVAMVLGITLGLVSGYLGGAVDARDHAHRRRPAHLPGDPGRAADRRRGARHHLGAAPRRDRASTSSSAPSASPSGSQYARTVRGSIMVEKNKEYVQAARVIGLSPVLIMVRHVLPNVTGPGAGDRHHQSRPRHHHRGDAVLPRRRRAADRSPRSAR